MYFDAFTLAALADEWSATLVGGKIQDVLDVDATGIGLEVYAGHRRHYVYLSADKQQPRVQVMPEKLRRGLPVPTQLGLMFRRYVEHGRLTGVHQPPYERILQLDVTHPEGSFTIVVEPMERRSNLLLLRDGIIQDCLWRVGPEDNRYRLSLPNHAYKLPPPMTDKRDPADLSPADLAALLAAATDPRQKTAALLTQHLLGLSPLLAREVVFRAGGDVQQKASAAQPDALYAALQALLLPLTRREWQPGLAHSDGLPQAFSVYPLTHLPGWQPADSLSAAINAYFGAPAGAEAYNEMKKPVFAALEEGKKRYRAKLASLESGLKDDGEMLFLQQSGELILAYQYTLRPGQTELRAQYELEAPELVIKLDAALTPLENAQRYFDRYNRAKRARTGVPHLVAATRVELDYLAQLENDLRQAANYPEIDEVIQALQARDLAGDAKMARRGGGSARSAPLRLTRDGFVIRVGRNSRQNEQVTFKEAGPQDIWLHARDVPGAHVIIRSDGRRIPDTLIADSAALAAYYSARRDEAKVIVDVTRCKYVRKIKGAGPGMVTYRNETTITVAPRSEEHWKHG